MTGKETLDRATEILLYLATNYDITIFEAEAVLEIALDMIREGMTDE